MSDLRQAVIRTTFPDGKIQVYQYGMIVKPRIVTNHELNVWRRWLKILKAKYHWNEYDKKIS